MSNRQMIPYLSYYGHGGCPRRVETPWPQPAGERPAPNIIWVVSDQQRAMSLSCNGDVNARTPNLDRMACYGVNFTRAVSSNPICCPFRGTMLTGVSHNKCVMGHQYSLDENQPTVADVFNAAGYETTYIGKWHLDGCRSNAVFHYVPPHRRGGFQKWLGYENNNSQWNTWVHGNLYGEETQFKLKGYETDALTDIALEYIRGRQDSDSPFFLVLSVQPPHPPFMAPAENLNHFPAKELELRPNVPAGPLYQQETRRQLAYYYAMIEILDQNVGRFLETLTECEMDLNTHILFFSDHGEMMGSHGLFGKVMPYEESIRIPFLISGAVPCLLGYQTGNVDAPLCELDIAPTTLGLCGIPVPDWMEGHDYSPYRLGGPPGGETGPDTAYIKAITPHDGSYKPWRGIVTRDGYKYVCFENEPWMLFDLNNDPYEQSNLVHRLPYLALCHRLQSRLQEWISRTDDRFELPDLPPLAKAKGGTLEGLSIMLGRSLCFSYDRE